MLEMDESRKQANAIAASVIDIEKQRLAAISSTRDQIYPQLLEIVYRLRNSFRAATNTHQSRCAKNIRAGSILQNLFLAYILNWVLLRKTCTSSGRISMNRPSSVYILSNGLRRTQIHCWISALGPISLALLTRNWRHSRWNVESM